MVGWAAAAVVALLDALDAACIGCSNGCGVDRASEPDPVAHRVDVDEDLGGSAVIGRDGVTRGDSGPATLAAAGPDRSTTRVNVGRT
jgi:hypothetical protein